jgi:imidazolonepropionase
MEIILKNIRELVLAEQGTDRLSYLSGSAMESLPKLSNAWLHIRNGLIHAFGPMTTYPSELARELMTIDLSDRYVLPAWCDSHTHLVFPAAREAEFVDKIRGLSYEEIARRGGGILNSARRMEEVSEDALVEDALARLDEIIAYGTGAVEIKSGYGLSTASELKMLRAIRRLRELTPLTIRATFLGAHAVPLEYRDDPDRYVDLVVNEMLPEVAAEGLADFVDVFCDKGFFTVAQTARILEAAAVYGLRPKIHANELDFSGGVQVGVQYKALSVDHLERSGDEEIEVLKGSGTMPTVLPGAAFFLNLPHAPVRKMIDTGLPVALASDFNPGSSPSGNMQLMLSMGCITYRMLPEEAIAACTLNGAYAMGLDDELGSIRVGKKANLIVTKKIPSLDYLPYAYGSNKIATVILNGEIVHQNKKCS